MHNLTTEQFNLLIGIIAALFALLSILSILRFWKKIADKKDPALKGPEVKVTTVEAPQLTPTTPQPLPEKKWFTRLQEGLHKTHQQIVTNLENFFTSQDTKRTQQEVLEHLFEILVQADVGVKTSELLIEKVKIRLTKDDYNQPDKLKAVLREEILNILNNADSANKSDMVTSPQVVLLVGVNGVGKTTTTGKLAYKAHTQGQKVVIGAADTFRAAAIEQLGIWAERASAELIRLQDGSDPASVAFETVKQALTSNANLCLIDTAGRLQNRQDLMQELAKISRVLAKHNPAFPQEVYLVLDATTGQNALVEAKFFKDVVKVTGLILTKLDGTAKGGIAIAIASELQLPIRYVGVGESVEDLNIFAAEEFVNALFATH